MANGLREDPPAELLDRSSGLTYRLRKASLAGQPSFLLLHGLGGDESVLWVIESALPKGGLIAAPRGLFPAEGGGFAWVDDNLGPGGTLHDFDPARLALSQWVDTLVRADGLVISQSYLVGFSQGSAVGFALAALGDLQPRGMVALAAYLPEGDLHNLCGLPVFWSHGTSDDRVPIQRARKDVRRLRGAGARVDYCETATGHKVGIECMRALKAWLKTESDAGGEDHPIDPPAA
jgi:phospholipase/carboxylesterase